MPEKYLHRDGLPILIRHTGATTLPQDPPPRGSGAPILFLHDAGLSSTVFSDLLERVAPEGGAVAFDMPGHGRSGSLDALPSIEAMRELASWVAARCGFERPILIGHGMGALVALDWARADASAIGGLVLCGTGRALGTSPRAIEEMRAVSLGKAPRPFDASRVCPDGGRAMMQRAYMEGIRTDPRATVADLEASAAWSRAFDLETHGITSAAVLLTGDCGARRAAVAVGGARDDDPGRLVEVGRLGRPFPPDRAAECRRQRDPASRGVRLT